MISILDTVKSDVRKIVQMEAKPEIRKYIVPYSKTRHLESIDNKNEEHLSIWDSSKNLIGFIVLSGLENKINEIEFRRIVILEQGRGFGSMAIENIKKKCFEEYKTKKLWLDVFNFNIKARHIYKKHGFVEEVKNGLVKNSDLIIMSITKELFNATGD